MAFSQESNRLLEYFPNTSNINLEVSLYEKEYGKYSVKGIQFDVVYDEGKLILNELTSLVDGATFEHLSIKEGQERCIIFNLDGKNFSKSQLSKLIIASFTQMDNFFSYTNVEFKNFIIVGDYGEDISPHYISNSFKINFSNLIPRKTYIYKLDENIFKDSIMVSFDLHEPSNVYLSIYDPLDVNRKTILDDYLDIGAHHVDVFPYDQYEEEFFEGRYKIKLFSNYSLIDSIYVVYLRNKN